MSIIKLDQNTINHIAAGEVIDRPSSIVKELIENSIDANATNISIEIKDGGISLIRITDNGDGIAEDDIIEEIQNLNLGEMTPLEGLNYLNELQNRLKNRWE